MLLRRNEIYTYTYKLKKDMKNIKHKVIWRKTFKIVNSTIKT